MKLRVILGAVLLGAPAAALGQTAQFTLETSWAAVPNATSYTLQRSVDGGAYAAAGTTPTNTHTATLDRDHVYCTRVKARNQLGESPDWSVPCCVDARSVGLVGEVICKPKP
jgi:hypothetical protein